MTLSDLDPFSAGSRALVTALTAWQPWADLFKSPGGVERPGNIVDTAADDFNPQKSLRQDYAPGDYPRVLIMPGRFTISPQGRNSLASGISQNYVMWVGTDTLRTVQGNRIKWLTSIALLKSKDALDARWRKWEIIGGDTYPFGGVGIAGNQPRWAAALTIQTEQDYDRRVLASL